MRFEIVPGEPEHAERIVGNLRDADREELLLLDEDLEDSVRGSWAAKGRRWAILLDGKPISLFGVIDSPAEGVGICWMLSREEILQARKSFVKASRPYIRDMLTGYKAICNFVSASNSMALAWLKWCGFTIHPAAEFGSNDALFHFITLSEEV